MQYLCKTWQVKAIKPGKLWVIRMNDDLIVDDHYLVSELKLSKGFINRNARAMGAFCRPRRFFKKNVMNYLESLASKNIMKVHAKALEQVHLTSQVNKLFSIVSRNHRSAKEGGR